MNVAVWLPRAIYNELGFFIQQGECALLSLKRKASGVEKQVFVLFVIRIFYLKAAILFTMVGNEDAFSLPLCGLGVRKVIICHSPCFAFFLLLRSSHHR